MLSDPTRTVNVMQLTPSPTFHPENYSQEEIEHEEDFFKRHHRLSKPIVVAASEKGYVVIKNYPQYKVAFNHGLLSVPIVFANSYQTYLFENKLIGKRVFSHPSLGLGTIRFVDSVEITVQFSNGKIEKYSNIDCIQEGRIITVKPH